MNLSAYTFYLTAEKLRIIDKGGPKSVTNDMENVLRVIHLKSSRDLSKLDIMYRDSEGKWSYVKCFNHGSMDAPNYEVAFL